MAQLFFNNLGSNLSNPLAAGDQALTVTPGSGADFPSPSNGDFFLLTLIGVTQGEEGPWEIVKVTARSSDTLSIVRAQEGTSAQAWLAGTTLEARITSGTVDRFETAFSWGDHGTAGYMSSAGMANYFTSTEVQNMTWAANDIVSGTFANARISQASVTQHQAQLAITESQITDLGTYADDGRFTVSSSAPSGGQDGDIWYQV